MPNSRFLSVVIPAFNGATVITKCLDSIVSQNNNELGRDYEIIVINDGSTDHTQQVVEAYTNVRLINLPTNLGRIEARRAGCLAAQSNTILFLDTRVRAANNLLEIFWSHNLTPAYSGTVEIEGEVESPAG